MTRNFHTSILCFDGEGNPGTPATPPADLPGDSTPNAADVAKFTQDDLNRILAEDKRKHKERMAQLEAQMQELSQDKSLSEEQRTAMAGQLEDLRKSFRTEKQQIEHEKAQAEERYKTELEETKARADKWENLYKEEKVVRSLQDAAAGADAFNSNQIVGLLRPMTQLKEVEGNLQPMIDFPDIDAKTGEEIQTLRTPGDAVKRMKELPKVYGNLFKSNVVSGVGAGQADTGTGDIDYASMTSEQYRAKREEIKRRLSQ